MADFPASRDMDAFLINPTAKAGARYVDSQPHNMSDDLIPIFVSNEILTVKAGKKVFESAGPLRTFVDESDFSRGYVSEEEAASPTEDDDFGFHSTDTESNSSIKEASSNEELSEKFNAVQLCTTAQAVRVVSAGKAKVVSVPKPVHLSLSGPTARRSEESAVPSRILKSDTASRLSNDTQTWSARSSSETSPVTPASNSFAEQSLRPRAIRRKPKLPPLQPVPGSGLSRSTKTQTPLAEQRAEFQKHDQLPSAWPFGSPVSPSSPKRKGSKFSPTFNFKGLGRPRRSDSTTSNSSEGSETYTEWHAISTPPVLANRVNTLATTGKKPMPKMVARGASERAPPIMIPPCPENHFTNDWSSEYGPDWPLRNDSIFASAETRTPLEHIRRKSSAAAYVTSQV